MEKFKLIIFDCDGVLVDSEKIANEVFAKILHQECGFSLSVEDMFNTFVGHSSSGCMDIIERMLGHAPPKGLEQRYKNEINLALKNSVTAVQGIEKTLSELPIPYCVASSGSYEKMNTTLGKTNLLRYFSGNLYSTSDVKNGKPHPDVYLHAAKEMGFSNAAECLVIEDSPLGVRGAVAAEMTVFGYCELMPGSKLSDAGAHHIFDDMGCLVKEIQNYSKSNA